MRYRRTALAAAAVLAVALIAAGCGPGEADDDAQATPSPMEVPLELVPEEIGDGLAFVENTDETTQAAFAATSPDVLIADGRLWEIRRGQRLIGTLQISTMKPRVDFTDESHRQSVIAELPGNVRGLPIQGLEVQHTARQEVHEFMWFGRSLFNVLKLKVQDEDPEALAEEIIAHQLSTDTGQELLLVEGADTAEGE